MKKIAKLSLVAAVAVAGLSSANAASLEEAIKGVDVSGQFRFRAQDMSDKVNGATRTSANNGTDVEVEVGVKVPVTDTVTAVFKIDNANDDTDNSTKANVQIEDYYFSYAQDALTVNFGQQNIPGRMTDGAQGDGVVALYNLGSVTLGAAAFMTNSVGVSTAVQGLGLAANGVKSQDVYSVIAMGNVGPVSLLGQYATVTDILDAYNVKADASVGPAKLGVEYTESELDSKVANTLGLTATKDDRSTLKAYASAKMGIFSAKLVYAETGKNGSGSIDNQTTANTETPSELLLWNIGTANRADADMILVDASAAVTSKISLRAAHLTGEQGNGANNEIKETLGQISYKVAKNLNTYIRYSDVEDQGTDYTRGRVEVKYSF